MTQEEYRDAIARGMGRAALAAQDAGLVYADAIVEACLHDRRFEPPSFASQAPYLHHIATRAGLEGRIVDAIVTALPTSPAGRDRTGMVDLLGLFARAGSQAAFDALLPLADAGERRAQDALATSGDPGLEWVVERVLPNVPEEEWGSAWIWLEGNWDDRTPARTLLRLYRERTVAGANRRSFKPNPYFLRPPTVSSGDVPVVPFCHLGLTREPLLDSDDAERLRSIVADHRVRKMRAGVKNLLPLPESLVWSEAACLVLGEIHTSGARAFGLELLARSPLIPRALRSLKSSAQKEDVPAIVAFLRRAQDAEPGVRLKVAEDADDVARAGWKRVWQPLAEWVYEHAPNAEGRSYGFDWIVRVGRLSATMLEEARYDANDYVREQAAERSRKPEPAFLDFTARGFQEPK